MQRIQGATIAKKAPRTEQMSWIRHFLKGKIHTLNCIDLLTRKCPMKHMRRITDRMRKATPKDIPKTVVLENTKCHHCAFS